MNYTMLEAISLLIAELREEFPHNENIIYHCDRWLDEWEWFLNNGADCVRGDREEWKLKHEAD